MFKVLPAILGSFILWMFQLPPSVAYSNDDVGTDAANAAADGTPYPAVTFPKDKIPEPIKTITTVEKVQSFLLHPLKDAGPRVFSANESTGVA